MDEIQYIGEHLWPRTLGGIVPIISFTAILCSCIAYYLFHKNEKQTHWLKAARSMFVIHAAGTFMLIGLMFYVMFNRYYEYAYAFDHVNDELAFQYMFSAFWEGQQGSFLLWMFWHIILGFILFRKAKKWEAGVMLALGVMQTWLASMMLGIHVPGLNLKLGDNPMLLLREVVDAPIFASADYLTLLPGMAKGLNLLLQNYWNVIHPPVTFLGFASVTIPFAFAVASLLKKDYVSWMRPALPWVLFSVGVLGVGILMGSAWAYEDLTFGGFWAWDPVENMSLVPWIMLLAGLHAHLITQATGHSRRSVYLFYLLAFCLSIYSTYLVRSGALEDTSVHAFTEMGLGPQLTGFLLFFVFGSILLLIRNWKRIPAAEKEEASMSREFWMFIGLMILAISSILITYSTSLPIANKLVTLFDADYEGQVIKDANAHYNKYQLWIAVLIAFISGVAQWLRFRQTTFPKKSVALRMASHALLTTLITLGISSILKSHAWPTVTLVAASVYGIISNLDYLISSGRKNWRLFGSAISHAGFGIMVMGIVFSGINKRYISQNPMLMSGTFKDIDEDMMQKNVALLKNEAIYSQGYLIEYERDTFIGVERRFIISLKRLDADQNVVDSFIVSPDVLYNKQFDDIEVKHPSIRRTLTEDVFTRIANLPREDVDPKFAQEVEDSLVYTAYRVFLGDTIRLVDTILHRGELTPSERWIILEDVVQNPDAKDLPTKQNDKLIGAKIRVVNQHKATDHKLMARAILRGNLSYVLPEKLNQEELRIKVSDSVLLPYLIFRQHPADKIITMKEGDQLEWNNKQIRFTAFNRKPEHPFYFHEDDDIALGVGVSIQSEGVENTLNPVYVIRSSEVQHVDDYDSKSGVVVRFLSIDPNTETIQLALKQFNPVVTLLIAENVARSDFIIIEALAFPGINLFWLGACLMLGGVFYSWAQRRKTHSR